MRILARDLGGFGKTQYLADSMGTNLISLSIGCFMLQAADIFNQGTQTFFRNFSKTLESMG
jgi:hypothetical protein